MTLTELLELGRILELEVVPEKNWQLFKRIIRKMGTTGCGASIEDRRIVITHDGQQKYFFSPDIPMGMEYCDGFQPTDSYLFEESLLE